MKVLIILSLSLLMLISININAQSIRKTLKLDDDSITSIHYLPDGKHIVSSSFRRNIVLWNIQTGKIVWNRDFDSRTNKNDYLASEIFDMEISPDGSIVAATVVQSRIINNRLTNERNESVFILNSKDGQILNTINSGKQPLSFSPDGKVLAFGDANNLIKLFDLVQRKENKVIGGQTEPFNRRKPLTNFSPDGRLLAISNDKREIEKRFETLTIMNNKASDIIFEDTSFANIYEFAFSQDGKKLAVSGKKFVNGQLNVATVFFDTFTWEKIQEMDEYSANGLVFSPNGKLFAFFESSEGSAKIHLFDTVNYKKLRSFNCKDIPAEISFSPNGLEFAVGTESGKIIFYKM